MHHDLVIIGGGPAGMSAAIYAARFKIDTLIIAKEIGGLIVSTNLIENWPGEVRTSGRALMGKLEEHVKSLGVKISADEVLSVEKANSGFKLKTRLKNEYTCKALIIATGTHRRELNVPGEKEFYGRGVSFCATCDAQFFKNKTVGVVGGSDSAAKEALLLSEFAKKVYIIYRKENIRAEPINTEKIHLNKKIEILPNTNIVEIKGDGLINKVILDRPKGKELPLEGLFIDIGHVPQTSLAASIGCKLNERGEITIDRNSRTSVPYIYAAGDCTDSLQKQAITGAAQGVVAAFSAYEDLKQSK